jgi:hypothetical protein
MNKIHTFETINNLWFIESIMNRNCVQIENAETTTSFEPTIFEFTSCHSTPVRPLGSVSGANVR